MRSMGGGLLWSLGPLLQNVSPLLREDVTLEKPFQKVSVWQLLLK